MVLGDLSGDPGRCQLGVQLSEGSPEPDVQDDSLTRLTVNAGSGWLDWGD